MNPVLLYALLVASFLMIVGGVHGAVPAASKQVFSKLFNGYTVISSSMDVTQNLYVTGNPNNLALTTFGVFKVSITGSIVFKKDFTRPVNTVNSNPTSIEKIGNDLLVLVNGGYSNGGGESNLYILDSTSGTLKGTIRFQGVPYVENGQPNSLILGVKIIPSSIANKVYIIATTLMDISKAAYGYSVARVDLNTKTVDWITHYLKPSSDGGSVENGLEIGSFLWVAGSLGVYRYNVNTGTREDISSLTESFYGLFKVDATNVLVSGYSKVISIDFSTLQVKWTSTDVGMIQPGAGPDSTKVWFARTLATSGNPSDWNVEAGILSTTNGQVVWRVTYGSGTRLSDYFVGSLTGQYAQGAGLRTLVKGQTKTGFFFPKITDDARLVTFDHASKKVSNVVVDTTVGVPGLFAFSGSISWGITYDGNAIKYTHTSSLTLTDGTTGGDESLTEPIGDEVDDVEGRNEIIGLTFGLIGGLTAIGVAAYIIVKKRQDHEIARSKSIVGTTSNMTSQNPVFREEIENIDNKV